MPDIVLAADGHNHGSRRAVPSSFLPGQIHLRVTRTYFYELIPPLTGGELLEAETSPHAMENGLHACRYYYCLHLFPTDKFADRMLGRRRTSLDECPSKAVICQVCRQFNKEALVAVNIVVPLYAYRVSGRQRGKCLLNASRPGMQCMILIGKAISSRLRLDCFQCCWKTGTGKSVIAIFFY